MPSTWSVPTTFYSDDCFLDLSYSTLTIPIVQTHMQARTIGHRGIVETTQELLARGGIRGLFTGLSAVVVGAGTLFSMLSAIAYRVSLLILVSRIV